QAVLPGEEGEDGPERPGDRLTARVARAGVLAAAAAARIDGARVAVLAAEGLVVRRPQHAAFRAGGRVARGADRNRAVLARPAAVIERNVHAGLPDAPIIGAGDPVVTRTVALAAAGERRADTNPAPTPVGDGADVAVIAGGAVQLEGVVRAGVARPGAARRHVARAGRAAAHGARVPRRVLTGVVRAVALVATARVTVVRAGSACRPLDILGAAGIATRAELRRIALARRGATDDVGRLEGVRRTDGARSRAGLDQVAVPGCGAADRAGVPRRVLAVVARAVAHVAAARVAVVGAGRSVDLLGVGRAVRSVARAELAQVALAGRRAADGARRPERIRRAAAARAGAELRHVARP